MLSSLTGELYALLSAAGSAAGQLLIGTAEKKLSVFTINITKTSIALLCLSLMRWALGAMIPAVIRQSGIKAEDIIGVGVDFTACTMLPVTKDGTPLCFMDAYKHAPHAYVKLWKHHAAEEKAVRLTQIARERGGGMAR